MELRDLNPNFGEPTADPVTVLLVRLRQRSERETVRGLVQFAYHGHAQELIAELEAEMARIEAEIADLEARAALSSNEAAEAEKRYDEANRRAHGANRADEKSRAARERQAALNQQAASLAAARKAYHEAAELRRPLAPMLSFLRELQAIEAPDLSVLPGLGALLDQLNQVQNDAPARRRGRKKRG